MIKLVDNYTISDSAGNNSWYRKYSNGWIEQGGFIITALPANNSAYTLTFPVMFTSAPLNVRTTVNSPRNENDEGSELTVKRSTLSNTGLTFINDGGSGNKYGFYWEASGF